MAFIYLVEKVQFVTVIYNKNQKKNQALTSNNDLDTRTCVRCTCDDWQLASVFIQLLHNQSKKKAAAAAAAVASWRQRVYACILIILCEMEWQNMRC